MNKSIFRFITLLGIVMMFFGGAGSVAAQSESESYQWDEGNAVTVSSAAGLSSALSTGGTVNKSIRLTDDITVDGDIESSIDATIDLNGKALDFNNSNYSIIVTGGCLNIFNGTAGDSDINNLPANGKAFIVESEGTLSFYNCIFAGGKNGTFIKNNGTVNIYDCEFGIFGMFIDNANSLNVDNGTFNGASSGTAVLNSGTADVHDGHFFYNTIGINNEGTLVLDGGVVWGGDGGTCVYNRGTATVKNFELRDIGIGFNNANKLEIVNLAVYCTVSQTALYNSGTAEVSNIDFYTIGIGINNAGTLKAENLHFHKEDCITGVLNSGSADVNGFRSEKVSMGIYNAGTLNLHELPKIGTGDEATLIADIGLAPGKVIDLDLDISSLPDDYVKMKVGQFTYSASGGYSPAGDVPYVVTSGYQANLSGIDPADVFQAYDAYPNDYVNYEVSAKEGNGTDAGEAQIVFAAGCDAQIFVDGQLKSTSDIRSCITDFPLDDTNAVIKLLHNVDLGGEIFYVTNGSATNPVVIDLNGHLLTGSSSDGVINVSDGAGLTIRDSGSGGAIVNTKTATGNGINNMDGTVTVEGGSISAAGIAIYNGNGTLTVTGGTFTGGDNAVYNARNCTATITGGTFTGGDHAVYNAGGGTATITGGTFIGSTAGGSVIYNYGTMSLGCDAGMVTVLDNGEADAVTNNGALTVGSNVSITSGDAVGINNSATLTVAGFPTFDKDNICDVRLIQYFNGTNTVITFDKDITDKPAKPIKVLVADDSWNPVIPGESGLTLTSGYGTHVKRGGSGADKDRPRDPGEVFTVLGVADGAELGLKGGEAVAFAGSVPVAAVKIGSASFIFKKGTGAEQYATATEALMRAVDYSTFIEDNVTVKMLLDVDLGSEYLRFVNNYDVASIDPARQGVMTLDLGGCQLAGLNTCLVSNSALSLTLTDTDGGGAIVSYSGVCSAIENNGGLTVKSVTLSASGSGNKCIYNKGTLTIDGAPTFETSGGAVDVYLDDGKTIGIGDKFALSEGHKITVAGDFDNPVKLTSGYGSRMRYPAGDANAGKVKAPGEVFAIADVDTKALVFAGGEAWVVESGTKALVQTATAVNAYKNENSLTNALLSLSENATVMLTDDVSLQDRWLPFAANGKSFILDLGGHEISGKRNYSVSVENSVSLDITDTGGGGTISYSADNGYAINNYGGSVSIPGGVTIEATGTDGKCIVSNGGTTTLKGWPTFVHGENPGPDIYLKENDVITFTNDITEAPKDKISVQIHGDNLGMFTSGYGAHVTYPAGNTNAGNPIDPDEVFTYKPYGTPVASVHPRLVDDNDAVEVAFWMPKMTVAYVDAAGTLHDDLTGSTPETTDDGHEAYILDGTETKLGKSGETTWYVCKTPATANDGAGLSYTQKLTLIGTVHLILADGCKMSVGTAANALSDHAIYQGSGAFTIFGQTNGSGTLGVYGTEAGINCNGSDLTINGGTVDVNATKSGILANTTSVTINDGKVSIVGSTTDGISSHNNPIAITGGKVSVIGGSHGIVNGMESITLGWRHHDDYIYASDYTCGSGKLMTAAGKRFVSYDLQNEQGTEGFDPALTKTTASVVIGSATATSPVSVLPTYWQTNPVGAQTIVKKALRPLVYTESDGQGGTTVSPGFMLSIVPSDITPASGKTADFTIGTTPYYIYKAGTTGGTIPLSVPNYGQQGAEFSQSDDFSTPANLIDAAVTIDQSTATAALPWEGAQDVKIRNARYYDTGVTYYDWDDTEKKLVKQTTSTTANAVTKVYILTGGGATTLPGGWYVVKNLNTDESNNSGIDAYYTGTVLFKGDTHLILADNARMDVGTATTPSTGNGIYADEGSLSIYAQSTGPDMGTINTFPNNRYTGIASSSIDVDNSLTINGGNISCTTNNLYGICATSSHGASTLSINGGNISCTVNGNHGIYVYSTRGVATMYINGGNISCSGSGDSGIAAFSSDNNANLLIKGGYISINDVNIKYGIRIYSDDNNTSVTINGGCVNLNVSNYGILSTGGLSSSNTSFVSILGGTFIDNSTNGIRVKPTNGVGNLTLGWKNAGDYIYAKNYSVKNNISIADGQYMMACTSADGTGTAFTGNFNKTDFAVNNGKYLRPAMYTITAPDNVNLSVADNVGTIDPVTVGSGDAAKTYYLYSPDNTVTASLKNESFVTTYNFKNTDAENTDAIVNIVGGGSGSSKPDVNAVAFTMVDKDLKITIGDVNLPTGGNQYLAFVDNDGNVKTSDGNVVILAFLGLEKSGNPPVIKALFKVVDEVPEDMPVIFANKTDGVELPTTISVAEDNSAPANAIADEIRAAASPLFMTGTAGQTVADVLRAALTDANGNPLTGTNGLALSLEAADYVFFLFSTDKFVPVAASASSTLSGRRYLLAVDKVTLLKLLNDSGSGSAARSLSSTAAARSASATDRIWAFPLMIGSNDTGITNLTLDSDGSTNGWYTIDGRRLDSRPTTKGVYIRNGHKEVVR